MGFDDDYDDDDGTMNKSLSERLGSLNPASASPDLKPGKKGRKPKADGAPKAKREKKASGGAGAGKKKKKRNPWSSSEEDEISDMSDLDGGDFDDVVIPRDTAVPRRNAGKQLHHSKRNSLFVYLLV